MGGPLAGAIKRLAMLRQFGGGGNEHSHHFGKAADEIPGAGRRVLAPGPAILG